MRRRSEVRDKDKRAGQSDFSEEGKKKKDKGVSKFTSRRSFFSWIRCILVVVLKILAVCVCVPPFLNYASLKRETDRLKPEGELYDIGWGQKMFMMCQGQGPPTVILDAPTGTSSDVWSLVWPKVATITRVCIYDRAGIGFSDRPWENSTGDGRTFHSTKWKPFTVERMVADLHHLLTISSQQPKPFILVGAELSALVANFYTQMYERDVAGMVLINPLGDDLFEQDNGIWSQYWFIQVIPALQSLQLAASLGFTRLALHLGLLEQPITGKHISDAVKTRQNYMLCHPKHLSSLVDEHYFINETFSQMRLVRKIKPFSSNVSVTVITGNYYDELLPKPLNKAWAKSEQNLISRNFPWAQQIVINGADHHMLYRNSLAVTEPISRLVNHLKQSV